MTFQNEKKQFVQICEFMSHNSSNTRENGVNINTTEIRLPEQ